jgi:CMP-N-acetylneuraminic acid synthetase
LRKAFNDWKRQISLTYFGHERTVAEQYEDHLAGPRDKTVVHIPARSGSTRIAHKNIKEVCGVPLMAYTLAIARALPVDRVIVNTDSPQYARMAEKLGAEVPFLRPEELARDDVPPGLALYYAEHFLLTENYPLGAIIDLYPTSLFRNVKTVTHYVNMLHKAGYCSTAVLPEIDLHQLFTENGHLSFRAQTDRLHVHYRILGNFMGRRTLSREKRWFHYELIDNPVELIDIDVDEDFALAEYIVENELYDFGVAIA